MLDDLEVHNNARKEERNPMFVVDTHNRHFNPGLLEYINTDCIEWVVYIVMPYSTSLWKVGVSTEHNKLSC